MNPGHPLVFIMPFSQDDEVILAINAFIENQLGFSVVNVIDPNDEIRIGK